MIVQKKHKESFWTLSKEGTFLLCPVNQDSYIKAKILSKKTIQKKHTRQTQGPIMSFEHNRNKRFTQMSPQKSISALLYTGMFPDTSGIKHPTDHWSSCVTLCLFTKFSLGDFLHRLQSLFSMIMWTVQDFTFLISLYFLYSLNQCTTFILGNLEQSSTTTNIHQKSRPAPHHHHQRVHNNMHTFFKRHGGQYKTTTTTTTTTKGFTTSNMHIL